MFRCHIVFIKRSRFVLLTAFSSTIKRSLQPHNDKLLIGGQRFLIMVHNYCSCFFLTPILTSILVLQFLVTCTIIYFFIRVGTFPFIVVPLVTTTTCYVAHDRLPYGYVFYDLVISSISKFQSMTLVFLSDHKRILLNDSHSNSFSLSQSFYLQAFFLIFLRWVRFPCLSFYLLMHAARQSMLLLLWFICL